MECAGRAKRRRRFSFDLLSHSQSAAAAPLCPAPHTHLSRDKCRATVDRKLRQERHVYSRAQTVTSTKLRRSGMKRLTSQVKLSPPMPLLKELGWLLGIFIAINMALLAELLPRTTRSRV